MEINLPGKQPNLKLQFHHNRELHITTALVFRENTFINAGVVECNTKDEHCFDKEYLRKAAIKDAISVLPRKTRTRVWNKYRTIPKTPRWSKPKSKSRSK